MAMYRPLCVVSRWWDEARAPESRNSPRSESDAGTWYQCSKRAPGPGPLNRVAAGHASLARASYKLLSHDPQETNKRCMFRKRRKNVTEKIRPDVGLGDPASNQKINPEAEKYRQRPHYIYTSVPSLPASLIIPQISDDASVLTAPLRFA